MKSPAPMQYEYAHHSDNLPQPHMNHVQLNLCTEQATGPKMLMSWTEMHSRRDSSLFFN